MLCDVVIFDLDGVVLAPIGNGGSIAHWESILKGDLGLPFNKGIENVLRNNIGGCVSKILQLCYPMENPWGLIERFQEVDTKRICSLAEGAKEVVTELCKQGKSLYIFTQRERMTTEHHLRSHGILQFLSGIHAMEDYCGLGKKHAQSLLMLLLKIQATKGMPPERCCFVGDSPNIDAHVALGLLRPPIFFGLAKTEEIEKEFLEIGVPKERIVSSLLEFAKLVA